MGVPPEERALKAEQRRRFDRLLKNGLSVAAAAREVQVSRQTGYKWARPDPAPGHPAPGPGPAPEPCGPESSIPALGRQIEDLQPWGTGKYVGNRTGRPPEFAQKCWGACPKCGKAIEADRYDWVVDWSEVPADNYRCDGCAEPAVMRKV